MRSLLPLAVGVMLGIAASVFAATDADVQAFFAKHQVGNSPDYAFVKQGVAGPDHLITIHGYADDRSVCEQLARTYNEDSSQSSLPGRYYCAKLN